MKSRPNIFLKIFVDKFLSIILKAIIICEAIAKLVITINADLIADSISLKAIYRSAKLSILS